MSKNPEITWSLMHPTPLDVEYMKQVVAKAANYKVDSFELCAACHGNYGGMDGLVDYSRYPHAFKAIDQSMIQKSRSELKEIIALAHSINKPVYYWHREAMVPAGLLEDLPNLLDENGDPLSEGESFEIFGDTTDREIRFADGRDFAAYEGKVIRLRFRMFDYSPLLFDSDARRVGNSPDFCFFTKKNTSVLREILQQPP